MVLFYFPSKKKVKLKFGKKIRAKTLKYPWDKKDEFNVLSAVRKHGRFHLSIVVIPLIELGKSPKELKL